MRLASDWRRIMRKAWSIRLIAMAGILSGMEIVMPMLDGIITVPRGIFAALCGIVTCAALVMRLIAQRSMSDGDLPN